MSGGNGNDHVGGGGGDDSLDGGAGNDYLDGADGDDVLSGGSEDDVVAGLSGLDIQTGGTGQDTFHFEEVGASNADLITDYVHAEGDLINLSELIDLGGNIAGYIKVEDSVDGAIVSVDLDGADNGQNFEQVATLNGVQATGQITFNIDGTFHTYDGGVFV